MMDFFGDNPCMVPTYAVFIQIYYVMVLGKLSIGVGYRNIVVVGVIQFLQRKMLIFVGGLMQARLHRACCCI
jgi:hypothetical protein